VTTRYAVYFAPDRSSRWREFGACWLGRDEHDSSKLAQPTQDSLSAERLALLTQEPARYGFHATLKAPFHLTPGTTESDLSRRLNTLAATLHPVPLGTMRVTTLGNFVALVPSGEPPGLRTLADACVADLDNLRAPLTEADRLQRLGDHLDQRQFELLALYGYPHVMDRFRFHMTLTGPVEPAVASCVIEAVTARVTELNALEPLCLDRLCLFVERAPGAPFHRILDLRLRA
jgi:putative phosphonate metabolism protein